MSWEIRWFFKNQIPENVKKWFHNKFGDYIYEEESRTDYYLKVPGSMDRSVKIREGKIEIKWLNETLNNVSVIEQIGSKAEKWSKLKWNVSEKTAEQKIIEFNKKEPDAQWPWIEVQKKRYRCRAALLLNSEWKASFSRIKRGFSIELTPLKVNDMLWWSICLDLHGKDDEIKEIIKSGMEWLFNDFPAKYKSSLKRENSYAYPKWLSIVCAD